MKLIHGRAIFPAWGKEAMRLESSGIALVIPGIRAISGRPEEPKSIGCRPYLFPVDHPLREPNVTVPGFLIKVAFLCGLKAARRLKDHVVHISYIPEVQTTPENPVDPDIPDHQHPLLAFSFGFRSHKPCEEFDILGISFYYSQIPFPPFLSSSRYILCANAYLGAKLSSKETCCQGENHIPYVNAVTNLNI